MKRLEKQLEDELLSVKMDFDKLSDAIAKLGQNKSNANTVESLLIFMVTKMN